MNTLVIATANGRVETFEHDIVRIQSSSNYSKIFFTNNKTLVVAKVLRWFNDTLSPNLFLRVHQSHLINNAHIKQVDLLNYAIEMDNGQKVKISKRKFTEVKRILCAHA